MSEITNDARASLQAIARRAHTRATPQVHYVREVREPFDLTASIKIAGRRVRVYANTGEIYVFLDGRGEAFTSAGADSDWERIQQFVLATPTSPKPPIPEELRRRYPLVARWAITDDAARGEVIARARTASLAALVRNVGPGLPAIREQLARGESSDEAAAVWDALAQAAMEAEIELRRRRDA